MCARVCARVRVCVRVRVRVRARVCARVHYCLSRSSRPATQERELTCLRYHQLRQYILFQHRNSEDRCLRLLAESLGAKYYVPKDIVSALIGSHSCSCWRTVCTWEFQKRSQHLRSQSPEIASTALLHCRQEWTNLAGNTQQPSLRCLAGSCPGLFTACVLGFGKDRCCRVQALYHRLCLHSVKAGVSQFEPTGTSANSAW